MNKSFFSAFVLLAALVCTAQTEVLTGKVNADFLNMRTGAGLDSPVAGKIARDTEIKILREAGNWLEILPPQSLKAYVSEARVNPDGTLNGELNVRCGMGTNHTVIGVLPKGAKVVRINERSNGWVRIEVPASVKVYVASFCVDYDKNAFNKAPQLAEKSAEKPSVAVPEKAEKAEKKDAPAIIPAVKTETVTLHGVLNSWKFSRTPETAYALLDVPNGRNLGFVTASDKAKLAACDGKKVTVSGRITGRTEAGAMVIEAAELTPAEEK